MKICVQKKNIETNNKNINKEEENRSIKLVKQYAIPCLAQVIVQLQCDLQNVNKLSLLHYQLELIRYALVEATLQYDKYIVNMLTRLTSNCEADVSERGGVCLCIYYYIHLLGQNKTLLCYSQLYNFLKLLDISIYAQVRVHSKSIRITQGVFTSQLFTSKPVTSHGSVGLEAENDVTLYLCYNLLFQMCSSISNYLISLRRVTHQDVIEYLNLLVIYLFT